VALSRVGGTSAAATSIAIPTHVAGDLIVIWAYRDGSTTPPTVPTATGTVPAFTTIDGPTGANLNSARCAWAVAAGTTDTSGTWTNATGLSVEVWRGASSIPIGGHAQSGGSVASGANIAIPAITPQDPGGNSVYLSFAGWQTVTAWNAAPAGYTQRSQVATECEALTKNTTTSDGTFNVTGTASGTGGTRTEQLEILADLGNRVSQLAVEVVEHSTTALSRVSQVVVESLVRVGVVIVAGGKGQGHGGGHKATVKVLPVGAHTTLHFAVPTISGNRTIAVVAAKTTAKMAAPTVHGGGIIAAPAAKTTAKTHAPIDHVLEGAPASVSTLHAPAPVVTGSGGNALVTAVPAVAFAIAPAPAVPSGTFAFVAGGGPITVIRYDDARIEVNPARATAVMPRPLVTDNIDAQIAAMFNDLEELLAYDLIAA
jgi:hypothetical protein